MRQRVFIALALGTSLVLAITSFIATKPAAHASPATVPAGSLVAFATIQGQKQGTFLVEDPASPIGGFQLLNFDLAGSVPFDQGTGNVSGSRIRKPVVLLKDNGASTPQIYQAFINNEILVKVVIAFYQRNLQGKLTLYSQYTLTNAVIVSDDQQDPNAQGAFSEQITLIYRSITLHQGKFSVTDNWFQG